MTIMKAVHRFENQFAKRTESFAFHHPCFAFFAMFVGAPLLILSAVAICTMTIMLPMACFLG